jgi:hypothetical protein
VGALGDEVGGAASPAPADSSLTGEVRQPTRRLSMETKASYKTTELFAYLAAVVGVLLASQLVGNEDGHDDYSAPTGPGCTSCC